MNERIGILTGGGDCPGLNAVIRSVVKSASKRGWETVGFLQGFEGLLDPVRYRKLNYRDMDARLGGIGAEVAAEIQKRTGKETRICVLGHLQRGGGPTTADRLLCTRFGAKAVQLIAERQFGYMVSLQPPDITAVPLTAAIGRLRSVPPHGDIVQTGRALGISFGDEHAAA